MQSRFVRWYRKEDGWSVEELCHSANDHMVAAMLLFDTKNPQAQDSAGFLAHLAIELLLKAGLLHQTGRFPDEHDLARLRGLFAKVDYPIDLSAERNAAFDRISSFHELRYHDPAGLPEVGHPDREAIHKLYLDLVAKLPTPLFQAIADIDHTRKSGRRLYRKPER